MAKVGGPSLPPVVPQPRPAEPTAPASPQAPASPAPPANLQQVANPFSSAFVSAGKLAGQLVKNLTAPPAPQKKQSAQEPQSSSEKATHGLEEPGRGGQQVFEGKQQVGQRREESSQQGRQGGQSQPEAPQGAVGAAFAALRSSRLFKARVQKKKGARTDSKKRKDDYEEEERDRHVVRRWIKGELEETDYDQGRREALRLQQLGKQGGPPSDLARQLNAQLSGDRQDDFRSTLSETLQPQLDALAERVETLPVDERRAMSAMFARASHQVAQKSATAYQKLLRATATAEAQTLEGGGAADLAARAAALGQALRRAASSGYRESLIEAATPELAALARALEDLSPNDQAGALEALLEASTALHPAGVSRMAAAFAQGLDDLPASNEVWSRVLRALGPALRHVPRGGGFAFELRAAAPASLSAGDGLAGTLKEARLRLQPVVAELRALRTASPEEAQARSAALREQLEAACADAAELLPACVRGLELFDRLGREEGQPLREQALLLLATLEVVGTTRAGQRVLRLALVSQERGEESFLEGLPRVARTLGQARLSGLLNANGLSSQAFEHRGFAFLQRLAQHTSTALAGPVFARLRKRDQDGALRLLRSGLRNNAGLYSLSAEGARQVCELFEELLLRPGESPVERVLARLGKLLTSHATERAGTVDILKPLVTALLQDRSPPQRRRPSGAPTRNERGAALTATELAQEQERLARQKAAAASSGKGTPSTSVRAGDLVAAQHSLTRARDEAVRQEKQPAPVAKSPGSASRPAAPPARPAAAAASSSAPGPQPKGATASSESGDQKVAEHPLRIPKPGPRG